MKNIEVAIIAMLSTISAIVTWFFLYSTTGGSEGPFAPIYTAIMLPPFFALIFLLIRALIIKKKRG